MSVRVAIGVATFRRPDGLARLVDGLAALRFERGPRPACTLIVVDNDPLRSAAPVIESAQRRLGFPVLAAAEPTPGLAAVRNRLLDLVPADAAALALIDDDEVPEPDWLDALLAVRARTGAAIVAGRVEPHFPAPVPAWVTEGALFRAARQRTGTFTRRGGSCNCLIDARVFRQLGLRFADAYGETGGEDTHLFWRAARLGEPVVWCDEAVVVEWIPPERATLRWLLRREYREGGTVALVERDLGASALRQVERVMRGAARIGQGMVQAGTSPPVGPRLTARAVQGAKLVARGAGMIAGVLGVRFREYAR
ncbi:MAG TPA: glycosyltransferase [Gemmatimonadales bacterium]|nr:glycosyltransferase [Gemmatimonadales bacterium]